MKNLIEWNPRVKFYQSDTLSRSISNLLQSAKMVPGLNISVSDVLKEYLRRGCPVYIHGGVIRDLFLGHSPNDIDAKVGCNSTYVNDVCLQLWGEL